MTDTKLGGCLTALVTPFTKDGDVDLAAFGRLVEWQVAAGVHGLVPVGSTGEAATMTLDERVGVVRGCVERAAGRVPVVAGAGGNDTRVAIETSKAMAAVGATHLLHVSPPYSKPPQRGILAHFRAIADASPVPIVVYNVPGRTASNIEPETTLALAEHPNICAVKEACGKTDQIAQIIRGAPRGFSVLSGDDALTAQVILAGGHGVVSVVSNAVPAAMAKFCRVALLSHRPGTQEMHPPRTPTSLEPLMAAAFLESNPIPIKAALAMMGRIENVLRLPLVAMDAKHEPRLRSALIEAGALPS